MSGLVKGTHMHPDLAEMFERLRAAHPGPSEQEVLDTWEQPFLGAEPAGTLRSWMEARHGREVDTFQFDRRAGSVWRPGLRTLDASRATYFTLGGSRRDYAGMSVLAAACDGVAVASSDGWHICLYVDPAPEG